MRLPFRSLPLVQREVAILIVLCVIAAVTFAGARRLAGWSRGRRAAAAAEWFTRGEELTRAGDRDAGISALKEAVAEERQNPRYVLALARQLTEVGRNDEARQLLLQLRQGQPDDVEINYGLARLAALDDDGAEAIRYYNYAMYGLVRVGLDYDRRRIRTELIEFLLDRGERQEALTELEALGRELPDELEAQLQAARLAERAGDYRQAFERYTRAGQLDPKDAGAAAGSGEAAFALRNYAVAARDLARAVTLGATAPNLTLHLATARLVLVTDPLAPGIRSAERSRRLLAGLAFAADRYNACLDATGADPRAEDVLRSDLRQLRRARQSELQDPDTLTRGVGLIGVVGAEIRARCANVIGPVDQAWELIAALHPDGGA